MRGEYHVHRNIFRGSSLPSRSHLYIYIPGASYLYVDIFRPDETLPRIIKLAKYFRATTVITQALLVLLLSHPVASHGWENHRSFADAGEENRARFVLTKYECVFVSRCARVLINVSISCHELHCYVAVDRAMSKKKESCWNASACSWHRMNENCFVLSSDLYSSPFEQSKNRKWYFRIMCEIAKVFILLFFTSTTYILSLHRIVSLNTFYAPSGDLPIYFMSSIRKFIAYFISKAIAWHNRNQSEVPGVNAVKRICNVTAQSDSAAANGVCGITNIIRHRVQCIS